MRVLMTASTRHSASTSSFIASLGSKLIACAFAVVLATAATGIAQRAEAQKASKEKEAEKPTGPMISKKVSPPLKAATDAYNAKNLELTVSKLAEAEAADGKT